MLERLRFIPSRLLHAIPVVFGVTILVFFMARMLPGDPATALLGEYATPDRVAELQAQMGLDKPVWEQYLTFMGKLLTGDLGSSLAYRKPVVDVIGGAIPVTLTLVVYSLTLCLLISIPLAAIAATKPGSVRDQAVRAFTLVGQGMPTFWVGVMLILILALGMRLFPVAGTGDGFLGALHSFFLPSLTMAIYLAPTTIRSLRTAMIGVLDSEYIGTARSKGLGPGGLFTRHVLRNSAIPAVSIVGVNIGHLVGGSLVIENVFALPGIGSFLVNSIFQRDFPIVQGVTLFVGILVVVVGIVTDIVYTLLDPRVDLNGRRS
ncbi:ABC transporter permease [Microbacterium sediminis]|uniref:ABC transporter permease n=1 Tax=Microbacterium sediminis TaxID=904291 RepID=A0A1B9NIP5_9MICO|nr:ABC transporter permease [Microbacterium sediminis]OCG76455.1 ABC transporter permease [Microbacterium sediminis]QBR73032.1 ABC transporter permease [Microbacterium sediminis]